MQYDLGTIDPTETSGDELADMLSQWKTAMQTQHSGNVRPSYIEDNMLWLDTSGSSFVWNYFDGASDSDIKIGTFDVSGGKFRPANVDPESFAVETSSDFNATDADSNKVVVFQAAATLNLPFADGLRESWKIKVIALGGAVVIDPPSPNLVDGVSSLTIPSGTSAVIYRIGSAYFTDLNFLFSGSGVPAGQIAAFARNTAPSGWLKANGATVSRTTYATLFAAIGTTFGAGDGSTTFNLPDLRGEFVRGWADTRGVDTGRVFGSAQLDAFQDHKHLLNGGLGGGGVGGAVNRDAASNQSNNSAIGDPSTNSGGTPRTASETRPRNVALLYCIKF